MAKFDKLTYLSITIVLIVIIYYHFNYTNHLPAYESFIEGFNNNNIISNSDDNLIGNPILPNNNEQIKTYRIQGEFKNNVEKSEHQNNKLHIDENSKGLVLLPNGYIIVNFNDNKKINGLIMKGIRKCRVDINTDGSNQFNPLFTGEIRNKYIDNLNVFTKESINQNLGNLRDKEINMKSIKITNLDNKNTKPIKLEIIEQVNKHLDTNINKVENVKINYPTNLKINEPLIVNKDNNKSIYLELKLPTTNTISGLV